MHIVFALGRLGGGREPQLPFHSRRKNCLVFVASLFFTALCAVALSGCAADSDPHRSAAPGVQHKVASGRKGLNAPTPQQALLKADGAAMAAAAAPAGTVPADGPFTLNSPALKDGDVWPSKFAGSDPSRTSSPCPGQNVSPPLSWSNAPSATQSFAILMFDPDGSNGLGVVHWVAYDIPPSKMSLSEGEASESPKTWIGGKNVVGSDRYFGPCGPAGHALHHYIITVVATDIPPGILMPGLTHAELTQQLRGHALAPASIVGRYTRPSS